MNRPLVLSALVVLLSMMVDRSVQDIEECQPCNPSEYTQPVNVPITLTKGFEMYIEAAIFGGGNNDHVAEQVSYYGDGTGRGTFYAGLYNKAGTVMYDLNKKTSYMVIDAKDGSCSYSDIKNPGQMYYMHDRKVIFLPDKMMDLSKFKFQSSTPAAVPYRGIDALQYTGCLSDTDYTFKITWYLSNNSKWTMEGGKEEATPLGMDVCAKPYSGKPYTTTMTISNFHNHLYAAPGSGAYHAFFTNPSERFCPKSGQPQKPSLIQRYSFRGEYVQETNKTASPVLVAYDSKYKLIRYDFLPLDPALGLYGFQHSWLQDGTTGVKFNLDLINGHCIAYSLNDTSMIDYTSGAMGLVGPDMLTDEALNKLWYIAVKPCRRLACDLFLTEKENMYYQYNFVSDAYAEKNSGAVNISMYNVLASVERMPKPGQLGESEGVEIFDFSNDAYKLWQFEIADVCYLNDRVLHKLDHRWIRLYFKGDHDLLTREHNAYLRSAIIEAVADATGISPMRVSTLTFDVFRDSLNVEFTMWEVHPMALVSGNKPIPLDESIKKLQAYVAAGKFTVGVGTSGRYKITADQDSFETCDTKCSTSLDPTSTKLKYKDGYSMSLQAAVYIPPLPQFLLDALKVPVATPWNTTFYMEAYHGYVEGHGTEEGGHGALYIFDQHKETTVIYNEHSKESLIIDPAARTCDTQNITYDPKSFIFGYLHNGIPIPIPDAFTDMTRFRDHPIRQRGVTWMHGFKTNVFETTLDVSNIFGQPLPYDVRIPFTLRWHWLDKDFQSEDGKFDQVGPVPISIILDAVMPKIPNYEEYAGNMISIVVSVVNYHNHFPDIQGTLKTTKDPLRELLEPPPGIVCQRIHEPAVIDLVPQVPPLPRRFRMKTEAILEVPFNYVINSQDFMDYNRSLFRYDVSMHHPEKPGLMALTQVTIDTNNDQYFIVNHEAVPPCKTGKISEAKHDDPIISHAILLPYEILNLTQLNEQFMGMRGCRDMSCYYWVGERLVNSFPGYTGTYEIWASTLKWHKVEDELDKKSTTYIKVAVTIRDNTTAKAIFRKEVIEIFEMELLSPRDLAEFSAPRVLFCKEDSGEKPTPIPVPNVYSYRGEYVSYDDMKVQTFRALYDGDEISNMFRYDHAPNRASGEQPNYRSTFLIDIDANIVFDVNRVTEKCAVLPNTLKQEGKIWDLIYPETLAANVGNYVGSKACRSKFCETFVKKIVDAGPRGWQDFETYFTGNDWSEYNSDNPLHVDTNVLSRIGINGYNRDGEIIKSMHQSVDLFGFTEDVSREWDFRFVMPCFLQSNKQHFRVSITDDNGKGTNLPEPNEFFRTPIVKWIANWAKAKPYRILNAKFKKYNDEIRVIFSLTERTEADKVGTVLKDAVTNMNGMIGVNFEVYMPNFNTGSEEPITVKVKSIDSCADGECDIDTDRPVVFVFDAATAFGVFFGCFIFGALVAFAGLGFLYSKRLRVSVKDVFLMKSLSAPSNPAPVNLSGLSYR